MKVTVAIVATYGLLALLVSLFAAGGPSETVTAGGLLSEGTFEAPLDTYNPVREGEETPAGYRQVLGRDQIPPVYDPEFKSATDTDWESETLVIGVALEGEAKAYPVNVLNFREMVNDWIGGTPILVSW